VDEQHDAAKGVRNIWTKEINGKISCIELAAGRQVLRC
jgi:hypothetical protein